MKRRDFLSYSGGLLSGLFVSSLAGATSRSEADILFGLSYPNLNGQKQALSRWQGQSLVVNFWATWCPPCVKEMPELDALHHQFSSTAFIGLAVDTAVNVERFVKKVQVDYPLLLVGHEGIALMRSLGNQTGGLPFTLVLDKNGKLAEAILGEVKPEKLKATLEALV